MKKKRIDLSHLDSIEYTKNGRYKVQLVFFDEKVVSLGRVEEIINDTERGDKGFGSSGR